MSANDRTHFVCAMSGDVIGNGYAYAFGRTSALLSIILDDLAAGRTVDHAAHYAHLEDIVGDLAATIKAVSA